MVQNQEIEWKLRVMDESCWGALCDFVAQWEGVMHRETIRLAANYFDTEEGALKQARLAYRVRAENEDWVATLKGGGSSQGGLHQRLEWNVPVQCGEPDLRVFAGTTAEPLVNGFFGRTLRPIVRTEFCRKAVTLEVKDAVIEVALDRGTVRGGEGADSILEVELELKCGLPTALLSMGAELVERFPLTPERRSKFLRGLILAGLANDAADEVQ